MTIFEQRFIDNIINELNTYESESVYITDKAEFNQHETIKKIVNHQNNTFSLKSNKKRFFFNIGNSRRDTVVKKIDLDTKDFDLQIVDGIQQYKTLLLKSEIKQYLKKSKHGKKINSIVREFVDMGNVVVKKDKDELYKKVNLVNLKVVDQTAETLEHTTVIEEHKYSPTEFRRIGNSSGWENVGTAIEQFTHDDRKMPYFHVYERYGEMTLKQFKELKGQETSIEDDDKYIQTLSIVVIDKDQAKRYIKEAGGTYGFVLFVEELEPEKEEDGIEYYKPYREAHFDDYQGRWFRKGIREKLFELQDRANILGNQIYQAMKWSSLHLLWTQDNNLAGKNIFESLQNGQIINAQDLNILPIEERNLGAQTNEWNKLMDLADRECQAFEVATGEKLPSGTTLGQVQIQTASVGEHFSFIREELGLFFKEVFNDWVLDEIIKGLNKEHNLELSGSPEYFELYFNMTADMWIANNVVKTAALSGKLITREEAEMLKEQKIQEFIKKPKQTIKIIQDYYKGIKMKCDVVITGESVDKNAKVQNGAALLNILTNPIIEQKPAAYGIALELADTLGFNVSKYQTARIPQTAQTQQMGKQTNAEFANTGVPETAKGTQTL